MSEDLPHDTPPIAFYFSIKFVGANDMESSFQEVSRLKVTIDKVEDAEGNDNHFTYHSPTVPRYDDLVLKRCLMPNLIPSVKTPCSRTRSNLKIFK